MPWRLLARDLLLLGATLGVWRLDAAHRGESGVLAAGIAVSAGVLAALCGYLAHEWGHLIGARASGSRVHFPERMTSTFLFYFDVEHNDRRRFLAMSLGGFAASAVVVPLLFAALPGGALSTWVALALVAAGVIATLILELPPFFRVLGGAPLPRGAVYRGGAPQDA
jgi:membrane-associated protease RseP (regulator of RpoE activity)